MKNNILLVCTCVAALGCSTVNSFKSKIVAPVKKSNILIASWGKNLDPNYLSGNVPIHLNGAVLKDEVIYIGQPGHGFLAIRERDGDTSWVAKESEEYSSSPVIFGDSVIYGTISGRVKSRKLINGELNYELDVGASVDGTPIVSNGRLFVQLRNHQIFSLDAATGKILWSYKKSVTMKTTIQGVGEGVVSDNLVIYGFADGDLVAFRVETGDVVWERRVAKANSKFMDLNANIIKYQDNICTSDSSGSLFFINPKTGDIQRHVNAKATTNLILHKGKIFFGDNLGVLNYLSESYELVRINKIADHTLTRVGIWKNSIIGGDIKGNISFISLDNEKQIVRKQLGNDLSAIFTKPEVGSLGGLVLFTSRGRLYYYH